MPTSKLAQKAKNTLYGFARQSDVKLAQLWKMQISNNFGFNSRQSKLVRNILEHSREHNLRSAKRLRASLVYYSYLLNNDSVPEGLWQACNSVELVHTALLMHDDFMDQDLLRRGQPTTQVYYGKSDPHYGESMAVCTGDAILCLGFRTLLNTKFSPDVTVLALSQLLQGIENTAYGQAFDITLQHQKSWTQNDIITLHRAKTAIYTYQNPLLIGAILGNVPHQAHSILKDYSKDAGVAFQLQDDILGVFGDRETTGKSDNSDLLQGKCTLLILKALELGNQSEKKIIEKIWGDRNASHKDLTKAKEAIKTSGSYQYSKDFAHKLAKKAVASATKLHTLKLNKLSIDYLQGIAEYMIDRDL